MASQKLINSWVSKVDFFLKGSLDSTFFVIYLEKYFDGELKNFPSQETLTQIADEQLSRLDAR